jgi:RimJ/RimL family protein N-acetyltransferase
MEPLRRSPGRARRATEGWQVAVRGHEDHPTVETNLTLREAADGDLMFFFEHQRDPVAVRMAAFASRDRNAFDAHWARIRRDPSALVRTILSEGRVAGYIGSFIRDDERLVAYWLGREFWGRGIATAALAAFLGHDRARPLRARVAIDNAASRRVLEKCGFRSIGPESSDVEEVILQLG